VAHAQASEPGPEYTRRMRQRQSIVTQQERRHQLIGNARLAVAAVAAWLLWAGVTGRMSPWWLVVPGLLFTALVILHERVLRARGRAERAAAYYDRGLARIEDRWIGGGEPGDRFADPDHPFALDLDLFGRGSLYELLCTARTGAGEETLAAWLREAAAPGEIVARQAAVEELRLRLDLREDLALLGEEVRGGVDPVALAAWGAAPPALRSPRARLAAFLLSAANVIGVALWIAGAGVGPFAAAAVAAGGFALSQRDRVRRVIAAVDRPARDLRLLGEALERFERERFETPLLAQLRARLDTDGRPPSWQVGRLHRLIELLNSRGNQFFAPLAAVLLWGTQFAFAVEAWRARSGPAIGPWMASVGKIEALCALAGYAYEHPRDPFPEIVPGPPLLEGVGLGHPLLPESRMVRNDVVLGTNRRVLIVSGSNMAGKSTLLRTVGVNVVLAQAGAPVRAERLRLSPLGVGATLRIQDSLQGGRSRFFAEITRLRQLVDLAGGSPPLLFLLDELLHGTNSHDRRAGGRAVVQGLVARGAVGLITTHDLALAEIAELLAPRAENVHFEDHFEEGKITFDYRIRPGVVRKSNALALMRAVGLEV
jgi:hypothetical protein